MKSKQQNTLTIPKNTNATPAKSAPRSEGTKGKIRVKRIIIQAPHEHTPPLKIQSHKEYQE